MNAECEKLVGALPYPKMNALEISGRQWRGFGFAGYRQAGYPEFDICANPLDETFDIVIAEQIFEHLLYPYRAERHVNQMLDPGGYFLCSVPFLVKVHYPYDCTRWAALGLKHFLHECGFPLASIEAGEWGNRACVLANFDEWVLYDPEKHDLNHEPDFPYHVWALARRAP